MCILQMAVEPGVISTFALVDFSRSEECLCVLSVNHISVNVYIIEGVVLTDTLCLIIELLGRVEIVYTDIVNCFCIFVNVLVGKLVVSCKRLNIHVIQLICILSVLDIPCKILTLFVDFVR